MPKVAIIYGSHARRASTITYRGLSPRYDPVVITARKGRFGESDLELPTRSLLTVRDITYRIPKLRHMRWGADQYMFGLEKALSDVDIVLTGSPTCLFSYQAAKYCRKTGKPLVVSELENVPLLDSERRIYPYRLYTLKAASRIAAMTERSKLCLLLEGIEADKIRVMRRGVDTDVFRPDLREQGRQDFNLNNDQVVVLFSGRLVWEKGILEFINAIRLLLNDPEIIGKQLSFLISGAGPELERCLARIKRFGLSESVQLLNHIPFDRMPMLFAAADIFVAPSSPTPRWQEQWGLVLSEAMSSGVAIISSFSGAIPEVVGDTALLTQPADTLSLVDAMKRLILDPELRAKLGKSGRERAVELDDWRVAAKNHADLLDEAMALGSTKPL